MNATKLLKFGVLSVVFSIVIPVFAWVLGFLFLPLAILWISPFFAVITLVFSVWGYFKSVTKEEKRKFTVFIICIVIFYAIFFISGFWLLSLLVDSLMF